MKTIPKYALVTGAGKGLGKAIALELASRGRNVLLIARKGEGLEQLCCFIRSTYQVKAFRLELDFTESDALNKVQLWLEQYPVNILVNNAGLGGSQYFHKSDLDYLDAIIQVNVRILALITRLLISKLKQNSPANILNIASMAACCPIAYKTVYPATKAFVYSFSRSLTEELKGSDVNVCVVMPGPIKTNAEVSSRIERQGAWVKAGLQQPSELAAIALDKMFSKHKVVIPGWINKVNWLMLKLLPKNFCIPLVSRAVRNELSLAT